MIQYISKSDLITEIERRIKEIDETGTYLSPKGILTNLLCHIDTLEVKEVDEQKERMNQCPFRQVGCEMYEGHILECKGACSWVVDYPKLKEIKERCGE